MDAGTAAVLGALAGAGITGVITLGVTITNNIFQRGDAKDKRTHDKSENKANRNHERSAALLAHRQERIKLWRKGLESAHADYQKFWQWIADNPPETRTKPDPQEPNIVGTEWFESMRPYLVNSPDLQGYLRADQAPCEPPLVLLLSREIGRLEGEWEAESGR
jgi:hypothetical protein